MADGVVVDGVAVVTTLDAVSRLPDMVIAMMYWMQSKRQSKLKVSSWDSSMELSDGDEKTGGKEWKLEKGREKGRRESNTNPATVEVEAIMVHCDL